MFRSLGLTFVYVLGAFSATLFFCLPMRVLAEAKSLDISRDLAKLQQRIEREETHLATLKKRRTALKESISFMADELRQIKEEMRALNDLVAGLVERTNRLERATAKGKDLIAAERAVINRRVASIYKMYRRGGAFSYLVDSDSATDLLRRANYLSRIAASDGRRLEHFSGIIQSFEKESSELVAVAAEREESLAMLNILEKSLKKKKEEEAVLLEDYDKQEKNRLATLGKLKRAAGELEAVLAKVMGEQSATEVRDVATGDSVAEDRGDISVASFAGRGLSEMKQKLRLPVIGQLIRSYGKRRHEQFSDMIFSKGLEFSGVAGGRVVAIAAGRVAFSNILPGLGHVIILDHGKRYYSLYGRLAGVMRTVGDVLREGDLIAVTGEPDDKGANFYFELRLQGKPINPIEYFAKKPTLATKG
ncbi:MAG: peptidoglycan DD-metalloendopeptidase family protein [Deltaproteobacteria bacterium]|nr:peptidoglycan DD-metalloendopeptidase family protein [Deltaproteobacteria bacterium]